MDILYHDNDIAVCIKPPRVLSTDEAGGMPSLVRAALGGDARTVHRLDAAVGGMMVLARGSAAAGELSRQIRDGEFHKAYLAVVHGVPDAHGTMRDLLRRDRARRMTFVADAPGRGVQEAVLDYERIGAADTPDTLPVCRALASARRRQEVRHAHGRRVRHCPLVT